MCIPSGGSVIGCGSDNACCGLGTVCECEEEGGRERVTQKVKAYLSVCTHVTSMP